MSDKSLKILMANKFYYPFGGPETCLFSTKKLFENRGHKVVVFSMQHPENLPSPQTKYFTEQLDFSGETKLGSQKRVRAAAKLLYSFEAKRKIAALIRDEKPDIAHLHSIYHQLSPSIITPLHRAGIPTIMTLHDYKLICLNYRLYNKGKICELCTRGRFLRGIPEHCVKDSYSKTLLNYVEHLLHRTLGLYEKIDLLISPSNFSRLEHIRRGIDPDRLITIENFIELENYQPKYEHEGYVLFFGRLAVEKGVATLIKAIRDYPEIPLKIVGDGPEEEKLKSTVNQLSVKNVEFIGFKTGDDLVRLIRNCAFALIPSEWYENCSMTVLEAFAYGKPVIGTDIGGIPEQIIHGKNGYIYPPGDSEKLGRLINELFDNEELIRRMGIEARRTVETKYSGERHYTRLLEIYRRLIAEKAGA